MQHGLSVCLSAKTTVNHANMDELIKMLFGLWTRVGPRNNLIIMYQID